MERPLVSVLTPCFHSEEYIVRAVRSVMAQTYPNWEMIIIADDDADYAAILSAQGLSDPRLRFIRTGKTGGGAANARNMGLGVASGRLFTLLDSDDAFRPERLQRMVPATIEHGVSSCAMTYLDNAGTLLGTIGDKGQDRLLSPAEYLRTNISGSAMLMVDRERIPHNYDITLRVFEDILFAMCCFHHITAVYHLTEPLYDYYRHERSISVTLGATGEYLTLKRALLERLKKKETQAVPFPAMQALEVFIEVSIVAEEDYYRKVQMEPGLVFTELFRQYLEIPVRDSGQRAVE